MKITNKMMQVGLIALAVIAVAGEIYYRQVYLPNQVPSDQPALQTATVRSGDLILYASGTGTLVADSGASFGFNSNGQVTKINVKVGDKVDVGQVLAELTSTSASLNYEQARRALADLTSPVAIATAKQGVASALDQVEVTRQSLQYLISPAVQIWEERLAEAEAALAGAQAVAQSDPSEDNSTKVRQEEEAVKFAEAQLAEANRNYPAYVTATFTETRTDPRTGEARIVYYYDENGKRFTNIYAPTDAEIATARADYELAKATLAEAEDYLTALTGGEISEAATGNSLSAFRTAKESLGAAEQALADTKLTASIQGTVMSMDFSVGDYVSGGSPIVTIDDLTKPSLEIFLDASDWGNIKLGYPVNVTFDLQPDVTYQGTVTGIDPGLYTESNSTVVRAYVKLDGVSNTFNVPLGANASVDVIGGEARGAILVPIEALHQAGDQYTVFVMENGKLTLRVVEIGLQDSAYAVVLSGLSAGDVVSTGITQTAGSLSAGSQ